MTTSLVSPPYKNEMKQCNSPTDIHTGFVAHTLTTLPPSELENRIFRVEGDRATILEVANIISGGANLKITRAEKFSGVPGTSTGELLIPAEQGRFSVGWDEPTKKEGTGKLAAGSDNGLWAGHKWTTLREYFEKK